MKKKKTASEIIKESRKDFKPEKTVDIQPELGEPLSKDYLTQFVQNVDKMAKRQTGADVEAGPHNYVGVLEGGPHMISLSMEEAAEFEAVKLKIVYALNESLTGMGAARVAVQKSFSKDLISDRSVIAYLLELHKEEEKRRAREKMAYATTPIDELQWKQPGKTLKEVVEEQPGKTLKEVVEDAAQAAIQDPTAGVTIVDHGEGQITIDGVPEGRVPLKKKKEDL